MILNLKSCSDNVLHVYLRRCCIRILSFTSKLQWIQFLLKSVIIILSINRWLCFLNLIRRLILNLKKSQLILMNTLLLVKCLPPITNTNTTWRILIIWVFAKLQIKISQLIKKKLEMRNESTYVSILDTIFLKKSSLDNYSSPSWLLFSFRTLF